MNKFFTLLSMGMLCLAANTTKAQVSENFTNGVPTGSCWTAPTFKTEIVKINGTNNNIVTTQGVSNAILTTPYIDIPLNGTVKFDYSTTEQNIPMSFTISLIDINGNITPLDSRNITGKNWITHTSPVITTAGTYRVVIELINTNGAGGTSYIRMDNLVISGTLNAKGCNLAAPDAIDDANFTSTSMAAATTGNMLANDIANTGETIAVVSVAQPSTGNVTWDAQGNFTFTPNVSFTGGSFTFSYTIADNGYAPLTDAATVTITYPVAPVANNDNFGSNSVSAPFSGNVITNDVSPNNKALVATVSKQPATGTVTLNADGTFTYTPAEDFKGGSVTFTYTVTDESYAPLFSNTATVTIEYATAAILPVSITAFSGSLQGNRATLSWSVADNEDGSHFEVQRSVDGKSFAKAATVRNTAKAGTETYHHTDNSELTAAAYYRLMIVNKDGSTSYSKVVLIKNGQTVADSKITLLQNPAQSTLSFSFTAEMSENTEVAIYNLAGVKAFSQNRGVQKGGNNMSLNLEGKITKGSYILTVQNSTGIKTAKFIKQ